MSGAEVFVVTGANGGLGFETARSLAALSGRHTVILGCRNPKRGAAARQAIMAATGNQRVRAMQVDVSSLPSVRAFVAALDSPVDALICNAGVPRGRPPSVDGIDTVLATNHLGHFLLTLTLLPGMSSAARVISVSSDMHAPPGRRIRWPGAEAIAHGKVPPHLRYSYSKLCNLFFTYELSRRLHASGSDVAAAAFNPGLMTDTGFATTPGPIAAVMERVFASRVGALDTSAAALTTLTATSDPAAIDGHYFDRTASTWTRSSNLSYDVDDARDLWAVSSALTGVDF